LFQSERYTQEFGRCEDYDLWLRLLDTHRIANLQTVGSAKGRGAFDLSHDFQLLRVSRCFGCASMVKTRQQLAAQRNANKRFWFYNATCENVVFCPNK
jgi:hypothetical protein